MWQGEQRTIPWPNKAMNSVIGMTVWLGSVGSRLSFSMTGHSCVLMQFSLKAHHERPKPTRLITGTTKENVKSRSQGSGSRPTAIATSVPMYRSSTPPKA